MEGRKAFTLLEVLVSITLMGILLVYLFSSVDILQDSNTHLSKQLKETKISTQASQVLFMDILSSDGNLTISNNEYGRLCIESTAHSLYALSRPKVCWVVLKEKQTLVRAEGYGYTLPTNDESVVEVDSVMENIELFDIYHQEDKVLVLLKEKAKEAIKFMVQGIRRPKSRKIDDNTTRSVNQQENVSAPTNPLKI